jgi:spermidine synthase
MFASLALCVVFAASGAAALVFETLWFHQAGLAFGSGVWSGALVLAAFMCGNALGSLLAVRAGDRVRAPLRAFAGIEVAVAVSGVALVATLPALERALAPSVASLAPAAQRALCFGLAFALLLVPATAMGATLPLLVRALRSRELHFGAALGRLYGWNTLGAVVGAVSGASWLVTYFGVRGAAYAAAALDLVAAAGALGLAKQFPADGQLLADAGEPGTGGELRSEYPPRAPLSSRLMAAALVGGCVLGLEVVWFRFLDLFVTGTRLSFALMLASVLAGIALGSLAASQLAWLVPRIARHASAVALALAASVLLGYAGFPTLVAEYYREPIGLSASVVVLAASLTLPSAFLSGFFFVCLAADLRERMRGDARSGGMLLVANTLGGAAGSLAAAFALLPGLGIERSLFALALVAALAGVLLSPPRGERTSAAMALAAVALAAWTYPFGVLARDYLPRIARAALPGSDFRITAVRESSSETLVYVEERAPDAEPALTLITNGHRMASTHWSARRYMKLFAWLPGALHPGPRRALLISYGVGNTAAALLALPELEALDAVDISAEVFRASAVIYAEARDPLHDRRLRAHVEDGRYFLAASRARYDLITAEPPPPNAQGVESLYSREYFELLRERLADGGYASYWLPLHTLGPAAARAVVAAFCAVFSDCSLWGGFGYDLILLGSRGASSRVPEERIARLWADPEQRRELEALRLESPPALGALFRADAPALRELAAGVAPLVDDFPHRILGPMPGLAPADPALHALALGTRAEAAFLASAFARERWPESLREPTRARFAAERELQARSLAR